MGDAKQPPVRPKLLTEARAGLWDDADHARTIAKLRATMTRPCQAGAQRRTAHAKRFGIVGMGGDGAKEKFRLRRKNGD